MSSVSAPDTAKRAVDDLRHAIRLRIDQGESSPAYLAALAKSSASIEVADTEQFVDALTAAFAARQQATGGEAGAEAPSDSPAAEPETLTPVATPELRDLTDRRDCVCEHGPECHHRRSPTSCVMRGCGCREYRPEGDE